MVEFDQMWFIFLNIAPPPPPPAVHTLLPSVLHRLDSRAIEALILTLGKSHQLHNDFIIGPLLLLKPNRKWSDGTKSGEYGMQVISQFQSQSHAQQPLQPHTCINYMQKSVFQAVHEMSSRAIIVLLFKVLN